VCIINGKQETEEGSRSGERRLQELTFEADRAEASSKPGQVEPKGDE
jgi:hypothetical protein